MIPILGFCRSSRDNRQEEKEPYYASPVSARIVTPLHVGSIDFESLKEKSHLADSVHAAFIAISP